MSSKHGNTYYQAHLAHLPGVRHLQCLSSFAQAVPLSASVDLMSFFKNLIASVDELLVSLDLNI